MLTSLTPEPGFQVAPSDGSPAGTVEQDETAAVVAGGEAVPDEGTQAGTPD